MFCVMRENPQYRIERASKAITQGYFSGIPPTHLLKRRQEKTFNETRSSWLKERKILFHKPKTFRSMKEKWKYYYKYRETINTTFKTSLVQYFSRSNEVKRGLKINHLSRSQIF